MRRNRKRARVRLKATKSLHLPRYGGLSMIGALLENSTTLRRDFNQRFHKSHGSIPTGDVLVPMLATLCTGKSDFAAVSKIREESWTAPALHVSRIASPETVRQELDALGASARPTSLGVIDKAILDVVRNNPIPITPLSTGHVALDIDPTPFDNSRTRKQGIGWTYKKFHGYTPIVAYAGQEGFLIGAEFREGQHHGQKGAPAFITAQINRLRTLTSARVLVRLDSGFDAAETAVAIVTADADFIIKVNPRQEGLGQWIDKAKAIPIHAWQRPMPNLRVLTFSQVETKEWKGKIIQVRRIVRIIKRLVVEVPSLDGNQPILRRWVDYSADAWITTLQESNEQVIKFYEDHGTSEQFHSELKGDIDMERLPSGKFGTNALVFQLGCLAYNLLRVLGIMGHHTIRRRPAKRRRLKTVIQELVCLPTRFLKGSNQFTLDIGDHPSAAAILALYSTLCLSRPRAA